MKKITFLNCCENYHAEIQSIICFLKAYCESFEYKTQVLNLSTLQIAQCTQCRCCTQIKGENPVKCVIKDDLNNELETLETSNAFIILADRNNLFTKNKVHEKFSKRLVAYHYWPFGQVQATPRKKFLSKTSILINYNTTKYFLNHSFITSKVYMEQTAASIGAQVLDWEAVTPKSNLIEHYEKRLKRMADKLIVSLSKKAS